MKLFTLSRFREGEPDAQRHGCLSPGRGRIERELERETEKVVGFVMVGAVQ